MTDPFSELDVRPGASLDEIKSAYRAQARKCHPDRFPEGPERTEAEAHMVRLNRAYEEAILRAGGRASSVAAPHRQSAPSTGSGSALFSDVRSLMSMGQLDNARRALMRAESRDAEWNYLFGAILMRRGEFEKATVYFGISVRMSPESVQYRAALRSAESLRDRTRKPAWQHGLNQIFGALKKNRPVARSFAAK